MEARLGMLAAVRAFFSTPARQAMGWAALGVIGLAFAMGGTLLVLGGGSDSQPSSFVPTGVTATATSSASPGASPSASASGAATATPPRVGLTATAFAQLEAAQTATILALTPSPVATSAPTSTPIPQPTAVPNNDEEPEDDDPTPEPVTTPEATIAVPSPTNPPVSYTYCDSGGGGATPPSAIFGTVTVNGAAAPAGTSVTMAFDGVPALSGTVSVEGNVAGYRFLYGTGGGSCTNRAGASISIIVDGASYPAPVTVGGGVATLFNVGN